MCSSSSGWIYYLYWPAGCCTRERNIGESDMGHPAGTDPTPVLNSGPHAAGQAVQQGGVVIECDIAAGIPRVTSPRADAKALVLVRMFSEPIGMLAERLPASGLDSGDLASSIVRDFGRQLETRFAECGLSWDGQLTPGGLHAPRTPGFLKGHEQALREGPSITVAICTRDRPEGLSRLLDSLCIQDYPRMRVLVVDNAPRDDRTRRVVLEAEGRHRVDID